jgi:hypothetical protein
MPRPPRRYDQLFRQIDDLLDRIVVPRSISLLRSLPAGEAVWLGEKSELSFPTLSSPGLRGEGRKRADAERTLITCLLSNGTIYEKDN